MCKVNYNIEEIYNHPKFSENYKFALIEEIIDEELFLDWFNEQELGVEINSLGLNTDDLEKYLDVDDTDSQYMEQKFNTGENFAIIRLYRYVGPISRNSRRFCRELTARTTARLFTRTDIELLNNQNPGLGKGGSNTYSVFNWRGGANCKHKWVKYLYNEETRRLDLDFEQPVQITVNGKVPYANGTNNPPPRD